MEISGEGAGVLVVGAASGRWSEIAAAPLPHPVSSRDAVSSAAEGLCPIITDRL
ncbi:hypothetical protein GCM10022232_40450 [Streptomyces plumbiresistens]|uniref:Uncharacterized protein n=1 Tax=Streptomyces plumbiresistens TaxID=511811 RepID=A0ABP7RKQ9_9ACTN